MYGRIVFQILINSRSNIPDSLNMIFGNYDTHISWCSEKVTILTDRLDDQPHDQEELNRLQHRDYRDMILYDLLHTNPRCYVVAYPPCYRVFVGSSHSIKSVLELLYSVSQLYHVKTGIPYDKLFCLLTYTVFY